VLISSGRRDGFTPQGEAALPLLANIYRIAMSQLSVRIGGDGEKSFGNSLKEHLVNGNRIAERKCGQFCRRTSPPGGPQRSDELRWTHTSLLADGTMENTIPDQQIVGPQHTGRAHALALFSGRSPLFMIVFFAAITLLLSLRELSAFWNAPWTGSFDGMSHVVVGEYYANNVFPKTSGWMPHWFGGMPFPDFYPPLFYWVTALIYRLTPLSYLTTVRLFLTILILALPGLTAMLTSSLTRNRWATFSAGCLSAIAVSYPDYPYGIAADATFREGFFTQLPAYVCLLMWYHCFINSGGTLRSRIAARGLFFLLLLSNVHVVPVAVLLIGSFWTISLLHYRRTPDFRELRETARSHFSLLFPAAAAAAFWYVPLLSHIRYFTAVAVPPLPASRWAAVSTVSAVLTCIAAVTSFVDKNRAVQAVSLACILLGIGTFAEISTLVPSAPLQPFRLLASFPFLSCVPASYLFGRLITWFPAPAVRAAACVLLLCPFAWDLYMERATVSEYRNIPVVNDPSGAAKLSSTLSANPRITNIEIPSVPLIPAYLDDPAYLTIAGNLAKQGLDSTYIAFRESAVSSLFMVPARNDFSESTEAWGIDSKLAFDEDFLSQSVDQRLDLADYLGIGRFIVYSPEMTAMLAGNPMLVRENTYGQWTSYQLSHPSSRARVLEYEPALFIGPVNFKKRSAWSYDYVRFQEEILFHGDFSVPLVRANDAWVDTTADLDRFRTVIMTDYQYHNLDRAWERLRKFAETGTIICVPDNSPLSDRLQTLAHASANVHVFDRLRGSDDDLNPLRDQIQKILSTLSRTKRRVPGAATNSVQRIVISGDRIEVGLRTPASSALPVLVKSSYFPAWRRTDSDEPLYMVTPTFILTYVHDSAVLRFVQTTSVWIGLCVLLTAVALQVVAGLAGVDRFLRLGRFVTGFALRFRTFDRFGVFRIPRLRFRLRGR
jgi:hypothetical protein